MRTPWVDQLRMARSVESFAEIQAMGGLLGARAGFDEDVSALLRTRLGDWRDSITWPPTIFDDLTARSEFYVGLGFDAELTDFPAPAFRETVTIARLRREPPTLVDAYGAPAARAESDDEEIALVRTNEAHGWLLRLETQLRRFIDHHMTQAYGPDWPRHRLPNGIYEKWAEKKNGLRTQAGGHGRSSHTPISQTTRQFSAAATIGGRYSRGTSAAQGASARPSSGFIRSDSIRCMLGRSRRTMNCCFTSRGGDS
jgi:hypothetical protein